MIADIGLFPALVFLLLSALALTCLYLQIAAMIHWNSLANRYRTTKHFPADTLAMQTVTIKGARFGQAIHVGADDAGLYLDAIFPFRLFLSRLFIPWQDISVEPGGKSFLSHQRLLIGEDRIPFTLRWKAASIVRKHVPRIPYE